MLNLILGRAGTGKTAHIMKDIKHRVEVGETGMLLIVPEQYSHDAERQLCAECGDRLSLHAETLSFTRLCDHVFAETGGATSRILDGGGQILVMHRALESVAPNLKVFGIKKQRTEILKRLLEAVKEFKSLNITPLKLESAASRTTNPLADKLRDLALIYNAYDALLQTHGGDATERLTLLADKISESTVGNTGHIYFDGFNDFTAQEMQIIEELLKKNADITVCLTCDPNDNGEIFEIPRRTAIQLSRLTNKQTQSTTTSPPSRTPELTFLEKHLFDDAPLKYPEKSNAITIYAAPTRYAECEYAAAFVWNLVRSGYRWREIGVMARDWAEYGSICENVFEKYGIPYFSSGRADILTKPPMALIEAALEIATSGWEYKTVFRYLKTGLLEVTTDESAILENYVLKWQIRGTLWLRDWTMPPSGYGPEKENDKELLEQINNLRKKITKPLLHLRDGIKGDSKAEEKLRALYKFLTEISLPERLTERADEFTKRGEKRLAEEYTQLLDITINALDQMYTILGDKELSAVEFRKLLTLVLSQHDVGVIPISLDRTPLGGMAMSRRRDLKCLIILGATDENLPTLVKNSGALSDNERVELFKLQADIPAGLEERLNREMNMLYSTLTLPSDKLVIIYPTNGGQRPSFLVKRLGAMFGVPELTLTEEEYMSAAEKPYAELLLRNKRSNSPATRERLSKQAAENLYGEDISLSATRVDRYYSCPYKHFLQNGLRLEPRTPAVFDASSAGIFMHYVLDGVFKEVKAGNGFKSTDEKLCRELTKRYTEKFVNEVLLDFEGKDSRFVYLFRRYEADVVHVVQDMLDELKNSQFEPLELEMDMSGLSKTHRGFIDRVDGFSHEDKLYLRVIDYKTRKKAFSFELSDVLNGRDMQMLIYLFALQKYGSKRFGGKIEPSGVLYVPARDVILNAPRNATEDEIEEKRRGEMRRSGIVLDDPTILEAMESGDEKKYLPVKTTKEGTFTGDSLVSNDQVALLSKHVDRMLSGAKEEILSGENKCSPYYKSANDNACTYCEYSTVCCFDEEMGDKRRFVRKLKLEETWKAIENGQFSIDIPAEAQN